MGFVVVIFGISLGVLFFCYIGYGLLIIVLNTVKKAFRQTPPLPVYEQAVTLIIAAYNEAGILKKKLANTLAIDYPAHKLKIILVTDGSTDNSAIIANEYPSVTVLHQPERKGKIAAIARAMQIADTPVVVFSDANTMLNNECLTKMMVHYADAKTGGVAGEKKIIQHKHNSVVGMAEGLYWQYESFMKKQDAAFNTVTGAAGELFSIRRELFQLPNENIILDDFIISMKICLQGFTIKYEPQAFASELPSASLAEEKKRKTRIAAGAYQSIGYLKECLNVFKHPVLFFQYLSRRLLRWIFCPWMLVVLLVANIIIVNSEASNVFYTGFMIVQMLFYALSLAGWLLIMANKKAGWLAIPFYFLFMNYCLMVGFFKFIKGGQTVLWEKSARQTDV